MVPGKMTMIEKNNGIPLIQIIPIRLLPMAVYNLGTDEGPRLRFGSELIAEDAFVLAIKAAEKDPERVAMAVEAFLASHWEQE
jgi:hypothetical protein